MLTNLRVYKAKDKDISANSRLDFYKGFWLWKSKVGRIELTRKKNYKFVITTTDEYLEMFKELVEDLLMSDFAAYIELGW